MEMTSSYYLIQGKGLHSDWRQLPEPAQPPKEARLSDALRAARRAEARGADMSWDFVVYRVILRKIKDIVVS